MSKTTPHREKLLAAIGNPKAKADLPILKEALKAYESWISRMNVLASKGQQRLKEMTGLLNDYKDYVEVELIAHRGSPFLKRQKGQLKLDNSILEEFLIHLIHPAIFNNLPDFDIETGPKTTFMSLSFRPSGISKLNDKPEVVLKLKDQDFTIGKTLYYKFSSDTRFNLSQTLEGQLFLAVLAAECKVNFDKTMFQECVGTSSRLKQGCPISKYYVLVEYLDMQPEDCRLTDIDNVFLLRHAKRLPTHKRNSYESVREQHQEFPIDSEVLAKFVKEIQDFIDATWYNPNEAITRGSFV